MSNQLSPKQKYEKRWIEEGDRSGWLLPKKAHWLKRLPIVRLFRATWIGFRIDRHNNTYRSMGLIPTGYDEWVLYAIARGWC